MKSLGMLSILSGVYINDALFIHLFMPAFLMIVTCILGLIGLVVAFASWKMNNEKGYRYLAMIGLLLNGFPLLSYLYLYVML